MVSLIAPPKPKRSDDPVVARGQDAWEHLQEDAPRRRALSRGPGDKAIERRKKSQSEHRRWWREVGEALAAGKQATTTGHEYYAWLKANDLDDIPRPARAAAIWFAANVEALGVLPDGVASPGTIRQWARKQSTVSRSPPSVGTAHMTELAAHVREVLLPLRQVLSALGRETDDLTNAQKTADLLLETAVNLQRGADYLRDAAQVVQQSITTGTSH